MKRWEILKSIFELVSMHFEYPTIISNTKRNLVSSRASRKVDEGGNGKNDNDLHIMVSFVTKRDININIFRTTFNHHFSKSILGGRSLNTLNKICPLLTTYIPRVDIGEEMFLLTKYIL